MVWPWFDAHNSYINNTLELNMTNIRIAAFVGNHHASFRVTPFFDTHAEARAAAIKAGHKESWNRQIANWSEHMRWNAERVGMYKEQPVAE